jgi:acid phosphatase
VGLHPAPAFTKASIPGLLLAVSLPLRKGVPLVLHPPEAFVLGRDHSHRATGRPIKATKPGARAHIGRRTRKPELGVEHLEERTLLNAGSLAQQIFMPVNLASLFARQMLASPSAVPQPAHVVVVLEENHGYSDIIGSPDAPYLNALAQDPNTALFTNSHAIEHPSQPNYLDLFSGSNQNVIGDFYPQNAPYTTDNLAAELRTAGKTYAIFSENLPYFGYTGNSAGGAHGYVHRHNPAVDWQGAAQNGLSPSQNLAFSSFPTTNFSQLPTVSFVIPNLNDDMHDGTVQQGDAWLKQDINSYAQWAKTHNSVLIVTWDEDDFGASNHIATLMTGQGIRGGQYNESINHFNVLRTIEDMYHTGHAGASASAAPITDIWQVNAGKTNGPAPMLSVQDVHGSVGQPIVLDISASLSASHGSEILDSVTLSGVPASAELKDAFGHILRANRDGSYTLAPSQLQGLTITTADSTPLTLRAMATARSSTGALSYSATATIKVSFGSESFPGPAGPAVQDVIAFADQIDNAVHGFETFVDNAGESIRNIPLIGSLLSGTIDTIEGDVQSAVGTVDVIDVYVHDLLTNYLGDINNIVSQVQAALQNNWGGIYGVITSAQAIGNDISNLVNGNVSWWDIIPTGEDIVHNIENIVNNAGSAVQELNNGFGSVVQLATNILDNVDGAVPPLQMPASVTPGDWSAFQSYLNSATGTVQRPGTLVEPLINGSTAFPAMYQAIDQATSSVNLSVFEFDSDTTGQQMAQHLIGAAQRGCEVRLIYDPTGSKSTDPSLFTRMEQAGVQVVAQPSGTLEDHLTHRKLLVVDGKVGFIGGMNIGDNYQYVWHDVNSRVTGLGVADLQQAFVQQWAIDAGPISSVDHALLFPKLSAVAGAGSARILTHTGLADQNEKLAYLLAIDTATTSINIASPYLSDQDIVNALCVAAQRGVQVTVVLPQTNDEPLVQLAERADYNQMLAAGVRIFEYYGRPMAHEKVATFDGVIATIGSSNLDARSLINNDEANVWTSDPRVAAQLNQQLFAQDIAQSVRITSHYPGALQSIEESFAHDIIPLL